MALFKKLNKKLVTENFKKETFVSLSEEDIKKIENELVFGNLLEDLMVDDIEGTYNDLQKSNDEEETSNGK